MRGKGVSVRETEREKERDTAGKGVRDKRKGKRQGGEPAIRRGENGTI